MRGEGRDGYRTCDVGVSLHSKTYPLFMKYSNGTSTQCYAYHYPSLFPVLFLHMSLFNSKICLYNVQYASKKVCISVLFNGWSI